MLRGLSRLVTRSCRNAVMRPAIGASILARFFFASSEKTMVQAKIAFNLFESIGATTPFSDGEQLFLRNLEIFQVVDMPQDRFPRVPGFGAPRALREAIQALFDVFREPNGKHGKTSAIQV